MKTLVFIYIFLFASLIKVQANNTDPHTHTQPQPKVQQSQPPKDCVKHPQIVKPQATEKAKVADKVTKTLPYRGGGSSIPHFSVLNFINFFYTKDTLDNLHVM
ncbi:MAG: hypothetical protein V4677_03770 [Bacteroidota bacterium]